jgi:DNA repair protein RecO (recombination protein O)
MPLYTADALILRTYKLGEADRIVVFLTRDRGKKRGVAKNAARSRKRFGGALEPLTRVRLAYDEREHRELVRIDYAEIGRSPLAAVQPEALDYVGYFAELIDEWAPEADPDEKLYRLGASALEALALGAPLDRLARYVEFWLLRLQGVYPPLGACPACGGSFFERGGVVSVRDRRFLCRGCGPAGAADVVSREAFEFLRQALTTPPERLGDIPLAARAGRELETAHRLLLATYLDKDLRSARILRELGGAQG